MSLSPQDVDGIRNRIHAGKMPPDRGSLAETVLVLLAEVERLSADVAAGDADSDSSRRGHKGSLSYLRPVRGRQIGTQSLPEAIVRYSAIHDHVGFDADPEIACFATGIAHQLNRNGVCVNCDEVVELT